MWNRQWRYLIESDYRKHSFCAKMIIEDAFRPIVSKKESWARGQNQASKTAPEQYYLAQNDPSDHSDQPTATDYQPPVSWHCSTNSSEREGAGNPSVADRAGIRLAGQLTPDVSPVINNSLSRNMWFAKSPGAATRRATRNTWSTGRDTAKNRTWQPWGNLNETAKRYTQKHPVRMSGRPPLDLFPAINREPGHRDFRQINPLTHTLSTGIINPPVDTESWV